MIASDSEIMDQRAMYFGNLVAGLEYSPGIEYRYIPVESLEYCLDNYGLNNSWVLYHE